VTGLFAAAASASVHRPCRGERSLGCRPGCVGRGNPASPSPRPSGRFERSLRGGDPARLDRRLCGRGNGPVLGDRCLECRDLSVKRVDQGPVLSRRVAECCDLARSESIEPSQASISAGRPTCPRSPASIAAMRRRVACAFSSDAFASPAMHSGRERELAPADDAVPRSAQASPRDRPQSPTSEFGEAPFHRPQRMRGRLHLPMSRGSRTGRRSRRAPLLRGCRASGGPPVVTAVPVCARERRTPAGAAVSARRRAARRRRAVRPSRRRETSQDASNPPATSGPAAPLPLPRLASRARLLPAVPRADAPRIAAASIAAAIPGPARCPPPFPPRAPPFHPLAPPFPTPFFCPAHFTPGGFVARAISPRCPRHFHPRCRCWRTRCRPGRSAGVDGAGDDDGRSQEKQTPP